MARLSKCLNLDVNVYCRQECSKELAIDHCHTTRKARGLLCSRCNTALGLFKDDPGVIENALIYLANSVLSH